MTETTSSQGDLVNDTTIPSDAWEQGLLLSKLVKARDNGTLDAEGQAQLAALQQTRAHTADLPARSPLQEPVAGLPVRELPPSSTVTGRAPDPIAELYDLLVRCRAYDEAVEVPTLEALRAGYRGSSPELLYGHIRGWQEQLAKLDAENKAKTLNADPNPPDGVAIDDPDVQLGDADQVAKVKKAVEAAKKAKAGKVVQKVDLDGRLISKIRKEEMGTWRPSASTSRPPTR
jgi:hypothetical protein